MQQDNWIYNKEEERSKREYQDYARRERRKRRQRSTCGLLLVEVPSALPRVTW